MEGQMIIRCVPVTEEWKERHKDRGGECGEFTVKTHLRNVTRAGKVMLVRNVMQVLDFTKDDLVLLLMVLADRSGKIASHEETRFDLDALRRAGGAT